MTDARYGYCSAFVEATDASTVTALLSTALDAPYERGALRVPGVVMDVRQNPDVDVTIEPPPGSEFVRWPVKIEVEADDPNARVTMVSLISRLLTALWDAGYPTVAACDFEEELPWSGGIQRVAEPS